MARKQNFEAFRQYEGETTLMILRTYAERLVCSLLIFQMCFAPAAMGKTTDKPPPTGESSDAVTHPRATTPEINPPKNYAYTFLSLDTGTSEVAAESELDPFEVTRQRIYFEGQTLSLNNLRLHVYKYDSTPNRNTAAVGSSFTRAGVFGSSAENGNYRLALVDRKGRDFLNLLSNIESYVFQDSYLIWLEKGSDRARFIDLRFFEPALGKTALPVYKIPIAIKENRTLKWDGQKLTVANIPMPLGAMEAFAQMNQVAFNTTVNLLDLEAFGSTSVYLEKFQQVFREVMETHQPTLPSGEEIQGQFADFEKNLNRQFDLLEKNQAAKKDAEAENVKKSLVQTAENEMTDVHHSEFLADKVYPKIRQQIVGQRKLTTRMGLLWAKLSIPRPLGGAVIAQALAMVQTGELEKSGMLTKERLIELMHNRTLRWGALIGAATGVYLLYPQPTLDFLHRTLGVSGVLMSQLWGKAGDLAYLGQESTVKTLGGFNILSPDVLWKAYFSPEKLPKFIEGFTEFSFRLAQVIFVPHLVTNVYLLLKDMKNSEMIREKATRWEKFKTIIPAFIQRQKMDQKRYLEVLAEAEAESQGEHYDASNFSELETAEVIAKIEAEQKAAGGDSNIRTRFNSLPIVANSQASIEKGLANLKIFWEAYALRPLKSIGNLWDKAQAGLDVENSAGGKFSQFAVSGIQFSKAVQHFLISFSSFTHSSKAFVKAFNIFYGIRYFVWSPRTVATLMVYPAFFSTYLSPYKNGKNDVHLPTVYNGGKVDVADKAWQVFQKYLNDPEKFIPAIEEFEEQVLEVEQKIVRESLQKSYEKLMESTRDFDDYQKLLLGGAPKGFTDQTIKSLNKTQRLFFEIYFSRLVDRSLNAFLSSRILETGRSSASSVEDLPKDPRLLKDEFVRTRASLQLTDTEAKKWVTSQATPELQGASAILANHPIETNAMIKDFETYAAQNPGLGEAEIQDFHFNTYRFLNPKGNRGVERMALAKKQVENPQAVARAVRLVVSSLIVDKPMELVFMFLCMAGIQSGQLMPIQNDRFGPDSWHYLSRTVFMSGYLTSFVISIFADVWYKLQIDSKNEGSFTKMPSSEESKMGYWAYYGKMTLLNKENSFMKNYLFMSKLIWANIPPVLTMTVISQYLTLGRFDADMFIMGYLLTFTMPLSIFNVMADQGYELAANWAKRNFSPKERTHPLAQEHFSKVNMRKRLIINVFMKIWENVTGYVIGNFEMMETARLGTRSFSRAILGGNMWAELWVKITNPLIEQAQVHGYPLVESVAKQCQLALIRNLEKEITTVVPLSIKK